MKDLDTVKPFEGDASLVAAARRALQWYQQEADKEVQKLTDFYVKEINDAVKSFNQTNQKVNGARTVAVNDFNDTEKKFADEYMPHYR